jgi:hypothetical protein
MRHLALLTASASSLSSHYGFSRQLNFKPYPDEMPRFLLAGWK